MFLLYDLNLILVSCFPTLCHQSSERQSHDSQHLLQSIFREMGGLFNCNPHQRLLYVNVTNQQKSLGVHLIIAHIDQISIFTHTHNGAY
ncbi:hypothetical protein GDO81_027669 [Engystomops pustulosus]|uniref:Secreted protein n=1 Tax=Engystomops pustulosus TaxID=76066 RepID=A0AAV6ZP67_ENGPU|nr:hypothetical protein GDO81_027669 [Engystomops pustulosus]